MESMANWNQAMIESYELGKTHTAQSLIEQWKEVIINIGNNTSIADRNGRL